MLSRSKAICVPFARHARGFAEAKDAKRVAREKIFLNAKLVLAGLHQGWEKA